MASQAGPAAGGGREDRRAFFLPADER